MRCRDEREGFFVSSEVIIDSSNIETVIVEKPYSLIDLHMVAIYLDDAGAEKLKAATAKNVGRRLAIIVNGELITPRLLESRSPA